MLLAVNSNGAMAEWVLVGSNDEFTTYVNPSTILKSGNRVKMWKLHNFEAAQIHDSGKQFMSIKAQSEFNCKEEQSRTLYYSMQSERMGGGNSIITDSKRGEWIPVVPDSIFETLWKFACGKR